MSSPPPDSGAAPSSPSRAPAAARRPGRSPTSRVLVPAAGLMLAAGLAVVAIRYSRPPSAPIATRPAAAAPPAAHAIVESRNVAVAEASGAVEVQREGKWVPVLTGDVLTTHDVVRTGVGRALLRLSSTTEVELRDRVDVRLDSISLEGASLDLQRGKVLAHVASAGAKVTIKAAHTRTANTGNEPARFVVTADEKGRVAVAATEGSALVEAAGKTVIVAAGRQTRAEPGRPPIDPEKIPEDILLTVAWPAGERHEERAAISGTVTPGSQVRINDADVITGPDGHFAGLVSMHTGMNGVNVRVDDPAGRTKSAHRDLKRVSSEAPPLVPVQIDLWPGAPKQAVEKQ